jgi:streptomycin 6-kinase
VLLLFSILAAWEGV